MSEYLDKIFEKHRMDFLKLYKVSKDKKPILLFDVQEQQIYAYPYDEFKMEMSPKGQTVLENQYQKVLAGTHIVAFARDNEQRRLISSLIKIDQEEFDQIVVNEVATKPPNDNNLGLKIDNYRQAMELVEKMKAALPISASPNSDTKISLHKQGVRNLEQNLQIKDVLYMGDEAGICCHINPENSQNVLIVSLTQLIIDPLHPMVEEITVYQVKRTVQLTKENKQRKPKAITVRTKKNRKKKARAKKSSNR